MARTCTDPEDEKTLLLSSLHTQHQIHHSNSDSSSSEEEALSLCDLPLNLSSAGDEFRSIDKSKDQEDNDFEFGIGSSFRVGSDFVETELGMSTADELFFKGRMLPLRHSVSLDGGVTTGSTRSESVGLRRTGSLRGGESNRKIKNNFIDFSKPSPQPQIRRSSSMTARVTAIRNPKSISIWDFLKIGLVRTPEIELRSSTTAATAGNGRSSVSRNSSCSSTSTSSNSKKTAKQRDSNGIVSSDRRRRGFMFADCKCSVSTETFAPVKINVSGENVTEEKEKKTTKKEEKTAMARKRTFEWLKELSQVSFVDHGRRSLV